MVSDNRYLDNIGAVRLKKVAARGIPVKPGHTVPQYHSLGIQSTGDYRIQRMMQEDRKEQPWTHLVVEVASKHPAKL